MFSFSFPQWEIHNSKEPVAMMIYPSRKIQAYKLKPLGGQYFYIREGKKFKGIFELDQTKAYIMGGKTPVYFFDSRNCEPLDMLLVNELTTFSRKNLLHRVERKDIEHASMLHEILKKVPQIENALNILLEKTIKRKTKTEEAISELSKLENVSTEQMGLVLTNYLLQKDLITPEEKGMLDADLEVGRIDFNKLVVILKERDVVRITSPLDTTVTSFLSDFGGYNPDQMASFVSMLSNDDKGLKQMTSIPIKTWMPASVIMALLIGGSIAMIVLLNNAGSFTDAFSGMMPNP
jgi:hypothetical protein